MLEVPNEAVGKAYLGVNDSIAGSRCGLVSFVCVSSDRSAASLGSESTEIVCCIIPESDNSAGVVGSSVKSDG